MRIIFKSFGLVLLTALAQLCFQVGIVVVTFLRSGVGDASDHDPIGHFRDFQACFDRQPMAVRWVASQWIGWPERPTDSEAEGELPHVDIVATATLGTSFEHAQTSR